MTNPAKKSSLDSLKKPVARLRDAEKWDNIDIKGKFTTTTITDVCEWRKINLPDSPNKLRKQKLYK